MSKIMLIHLHSIYKECHRIRIFFNFKGIKIKNF